MRRMRCSTFACAAMSAFAVALVESTVMEAPASSPAWARCSGWPV
jgi:hypothetical protein